MASSAVFLPGEFHEEGYFCWGSPWGHEEWITTEKLALRAHTPLSLSH